MSDLPSPSAPSGADDSPLQAAMYMADVIRKHMQKMEPQSVSDSSAPNNSSSTSATSSSATSTYLSASLFDPPATTPGLVVGITAGIVTFGLLTPVRSMLLQAAGPQLRLVADLMVTSSQAVASANVALYTGALTGSQAYLKLFNNVEPTAPSITADSICNDPKIISYLQSPQHSLQQSQFETASSSQSVPSGWDPRVLLGMELRQALKHCRQRNELQQQQSKQETISTNEEQQQQQEEDDSATTKMSWWKSR
jgi:hypothetical protein